MAEQDHLVAERYGVEEQVAKHEKKHGSFAEKYDVRINVSKLRDPKNKYYLRWIWDQSKGYRWHILLMTALSSFSTWVGLQIALVNRDLIDSITGGDLERFKYMIVLLLAVNIGTRLLANFSGWLATWTSSALSKTMRLRFFDKLMTKDYGEIARVRSQDWLNRLTGDIDRIVGVICNQLASVVNIFVTLITAVSILAQLEPRLILIAVVSVFPAFISYKWITPVRREYEQVNRFVGIRVGSFLQEQVLRLEVTRSFGLSDLIEKRAGYELETQRQLGLDKNRWDRRIGWLYFAYTIILSVGFMAYGGWRVIHGTMTYGTIGALVTMFNQVRNPLKSLVNIIPDYLNTFVFVERLTSIESFPDAMPEDAADEAETRAFYDDEVLSIGLSDVSFTYPKVSNDNEDDIGEKTGKPVLEDFSMEVEKGTFLAITGESGLGKSTIMKLLLGLYLPDEGERYIKTASGKIPLTSKWQRLFAYVPQGNMLTRGKIREVMAFGDKDAAMDDEAIWESLRLACADEFVRRMPEGLDTELGEFGSGLSEGQTQRISLARAIHSGHPIIMLDESTSALDVDTEQRLLANLKDLRDRTLIIITHRQSVVDACDATLALGKSL